MLHFSFGFRCGSGERGLSEEKREREDEGRRASSLRWAEKVDFVESANIDKRIV